MTRRGYGTALQDAAVRFEARLEQQKERLAAEGDQTSEQLRD